MIEIFDARLHQKNGLWYVEGKFSFIPQQINKTISRSFQGPDMALAYLKEECRQSMWAFTDRYTTYCTDLMLSGNEKETPQKRAAIDRLKKLHSYIGEQNLSVCDVLDLVCKAKTELHNVLPGPTHPLHDKLRSCINRAIARAHFFKDELSKDFPNIIKSLQAAA